jgi:hypothetical protein
MNNPTDKDIAFSTNNFVPQPDANSNVNPEEESESISAEQIRQYVNSNIPIVPLGSNGLGDVLNLFTDEEMDLLRSSSSNVLSEEDKKQVFYTEKDFKTGKEIHKARPLILLSKFMPKDFWTDERIKRQNWVGVAFLTGPTKIPAPSDPTGIKKLWGIGVDADDYKVRYILEDLVDKNELKKKTIVQATPHGGMHVLFYVAVDPNNKKEVEAWRYRALGRHLCKPKCNIEIKTTTMQVTLDPSRHRYDRSLKYTRISEIVNVCEVQHTQIWKPR